MPPNLEIPWRSLRARSIFDAMDIRLDGDRRPDMCRFGSKAKWQVDAGGRAFVTIQDPTPATIRALAVEYPMARVLRLELAIDLYPLSRCVGDARREILESTFLALASSFDPIAAFPTAGPETMRGYVWKTGAPPQPFDKRLPPVKSQLLYGHKEDQWQCVVYIKGTDQKRVLAQEDHRVRIELRMRTAALIGSGAEFPRDLLDFDYRAAFGKIFRVVRGVQPKVAGVKTGMGRLLATDKLQRGWKAYGVGSTRAADPTTVKKLQDSYANRRFGDALDGLRDRMSGWELTDIAPATALQPVDSSAVLAVDHPALSPTNRVKESDHAPTTAAAWVEPHGAPPHHCSATIGTARTLYPL